MFENIKNRMYILLHTVILLIKLQTFVLPVHFASEDDNTAILIWFGLDRDYESLNDDPSTFFTHLIINNKDKIARNFKVENLRYKSAWKCAIIAMHQTILRVLDPECNIDFDYDTLLYKNGIIEMHNLSTHRYKELDAVNDWQELQTFVTTYLFQHKVLDIKTHLLRHYFKKATVKMNSDCEKLSQIVDLQNKPGQKFIHSQYDHNNIHNVRQLAIKGMEQFENINKFVLYFVDIQIETFVYLICESIEEGCFDFKLPLIHFLNKKYVCVKYEVRPWKIVYFKPTLYSSDNYVINILMKKVRDLFETDLGSNVMKLVSLNILRILGKTWSLMETFMEEQFKYIALQDNKIEYENARLSLYKVLRNLDLPFSHTDITMEVIKYKSNSSTSDNDTDNRAIICPEEYHIVKSTYKSCNIIHKMEGVRFYIISTRYATACMF